MRLLLVQIGDIHIKDAKDPILGRRSQLASCISAQCDSEFDEIVFAFTGDYTETASLEEFALAKDFLQLLVYDVAEKTSIIPKVFTIPGNHDLDLGKGKDKRDRLLSTLKSASIDEDTLREIVAPQSNYREFASQLHHGVQIDWGNETFFHRFSIKSGSQTVAFHLLNSSWMSSMRETTNSLFFPVSKIMPSETELTPYVITVIHHPMNWFKQPEVMRELRARIEATSDLVISGHEHGNDRYGKLRDKGLRAVEYLEGGVLQERSDFSVSTFNVMKFDFEADIFQLDRFKYDDGIYVSIDDGNSEPIPRNKSAQKSVLTPTTEYADFLAVTDLPIVNTSESLLTHQDIFTYPDLRERVNAGAEKQWTRIKGNAVSDSVRNGAPVLIASDAMGGKTSLGKQLCLDSIADDRIAVFIECEESSKVNSPEEVRKWIAKQVEKQYGKNAISRIQQEEITNTFVFIDNLHSLNRNKNQPNVVIEEAMKLFDNVCASVDIDFLMEESHLSGKSATSFAKLRKMQICEFGFVKVEDLARRWLGIQYPNDVNEELVRRTCKVVERVLRINAMPHHPWILIVLLQEASSNNELAAKNGSYGYLYQAVITSALAKSRETKDVQSKYTYLCELAFAMYSERVGTFDIQQVRSFHKSHAEKYGIDFEFEKTLRDYDSVGILRVSELQVSFRDKYSYWFFVSWYLARNIHEAQYLNEIERLCRELHHEDSANILVFLSHFSNHPVVIDTLLNEANRMFSDAKPAALDLKTDLKVLECMQFQEMQLHLPTTDPDENYRRVLEAQDEKLAEREPSATDGRSVEPTAPTMPSNELQQIVTKLRAAMKAIDILGQVLRNGVGGITFERKLEIVKAVYQLARRFNGFAIADLREDFPKWLDTLNEHFHERHAGDTVAQRMNRIANHMVGSLTFLTYALSRRVSHALAHEQLTNAFDKTVEQDQSNPSQLYDLSCQLDLANGIPVNKTLTLYRKLDGNIIARNTVRALVGNYLYLHRVDPRQRQQVCEKLGIEYDPVHNLNPAQKKHRALPEPKMLERARKPTRRK